LLAALILGAGGAGAWAGAFVERLAPTTLSRGQTTRITVIGEELAGATGLWTSLPGQGVSAVLVEPSPGGQAVFDVEGERDAPIGLFGMRVATRSGLSNVKLFLIDELPMVNERESTSRAESPQRLSWPVAVLGKAGEADVDRYSIEVAGGERVTFEV